eukprot:CAMPEP_0170650836 /NCGR_PEP_ID=MMETSP0224-20130122/46026_1 /TAXON_ID=285029 /ORGANISM="Togula jolla, Strain CCCM 725" /LENGTH=44 /DNA_ID= /DNA_START= /DNA_END= /DNA_ORIENTATION=
MPFAAASSKEFHTAEGPRPGDTGTACEAAAGRKAAWPAGDEVPL